MVVWLMGLGSLLLQWQLLGALLANNKPPNSTTCAVFAEAKEVSSGACCALCRNAG